jgi:Flp pilus assembly protein TadD
MQTDAINCNNRACDLLAGGEPEQAIRFAREAVRSDPAMWQPVHTMAASLDRLQRYDAAIACYRQTLALCPRHPAARSQLIAALVRVGRSEEAEGEAYEALRNVPADIAVWCNLGLALRQQRRTGEAIALFQKGLALAPGDARLHWNLSLALLAAGRFDEGWREYEWRVAAGIAPPSLRDESLWRGEPLAGKAILLETEQGLGDTIQFLRYAPWLEKQDTRVFVDCQLRLRPLCRRWLAQEAIYYDYRAPLMSLPMLANGVIPDEAPYLDAPPAADLGPGFKVGLCWAGNTANLTDRFRSIAPHLLEPLLAMPEVRWIGLQQKPGDTIEHLASTLKGLDLVITVDTMAAHLAGALARPVWTLLSYSPDWRWLEQGTSSRWYPSMRLFRQPRPGDWTSVIDEVKRALGQLHPSQSKALGEVPELFENTLPRYAD